MQNELKTYPTNPEKDIEEHLVEGTIHDFDYSYEEGKKGYIVKWSGNNMKEIPDDERVKKNIEFLM